MEQTIFTSVVGNSPTARVLDFLITGRELDYSLTDIAQNSNIGWTTLHRIWDNLVKKEVVIHTRVIGKAKLFKLNLQNPIVKELIKLYDTILLSESKKHLKKKVKVMH